MTLPSVHPTTVERLYLIQLAASDDGMPVVCYLVRTTDGKNILIDSGMPTDRPLPMVLTTTRTITEQLADIGIQPEDINILVSTHFDFDHAGNHAAFSRAQWVVQRSHYEQAPGHPRYALIRDQWDQPDGRYRLIDGDTELVPGVELIETSGHTIGHQSVLIRLPKTGVVILTIDAVPFAEWFNPNQRNPHDQDPDAAQASTKKLIALAEREHAALVIFGHDGEQWATLKTLPNYYE